MPPSLLSQVPDLPSGWVGLIAIVLVQVVGVVAGWQKLANRLTALEAKIASLENQQREHGQLLETIGKHEVRISLLEQIANDIKGVPAMVTRMMQILTERQTPR